MIENPLYWFILFAGALGSPVDDMKPQLAAGPVPLMQCYAMAALGIEALNKEYPDKDFAGACWPCPEIARKPGMEILEMKELGRRALQHTED